MDPKFFFIHVLVPFFVLLSGGYMSVVTARQSKQKVNFWILGGTVFLVIFMCSVAYMHSQAGTN